MRKNKKNIFIAMVIGVSVIATVPVYADEAQDNFLTDMAEGLTKRWEYNSDENTMSNTEFMEYRTQLVNEEFLRLNKYADTEFENKKFDLMAEAYIEALEMQINALKYYVDSRQLYDIEWSAGYNARAVLIPDFVDYYGLAVDESEVSPFRESRNGYYTTETTTTVTVQDTTIPENRQENEIEIYNNEGIKIFVTGMDEPDLYSTRIHFRIENLNHHDILVGTDTYQTVINGQMVDASIWEEVKSGKTSNTSLVIPADLLKNAGIETIENIAMELVISDSGTYYPLYRSDEIFLEVDENYNISTRVVYTDRENVKKVQGMLNAAGYDCGSADGVPGKQTNNAILKYKQDNGLEANTDITPEFLAILEKNAQK